MKPESAILFEMKYNALQEAKSAILDSFQELQTNNKIDSIQLDQLKKITELSFKKILLKYFLEFKLLSYGHRINLVASRILTTETATDPSPIEKTIKNILVSRHRKFRLLEPNIEESEYVDTLV